MPYNFLFASFGTSGNLNPLLTAARQLRRRGHHIRVLADPAMRREVEAAEFEFRTWWRAPHGTDADPTDFSDVGHWLRKAVFDPAAAYAADIIDEIARVPTDAMLCIELLFGCAMGAEAAATPFALLSPHISLRPLPGVPPAGSGLLPPTTPQERAAIDDAVVAFYALMDRHLPILNTARQDLRLRPLSTTMDLFDKADRVLLATSQAFDFDANRLPPNLRYVGPLLDEPSWSKEWPLPSASEARRRRVLITCSSGPQDQRELVQRVIDGVGALDLEAIVTTGPNVSPAELRAPESVYVVPGAPHNAVMRDVALVVTQGGHGTVSRALMHGVPQLVLPKARDQADNAARIEFHQAGLRLPPTASRMEIAAAASRLITEPNFGIAAHRLGAAIKADIAASPLVHEMEQIAAAYHDAEPRRKTLVRAAF